MVELTGPSADTYDSLWLTSSSATDTGVLTWTISNAATSGLLCYVPVTASRGQRWSVALTLACPTGPSVRLRVVVLEVDGTGVTLQSWSAASQMCTAAGTAFGLITDPLPSTSASLRIRVELADGATGTGRTLTVTGRSAKPYAAPDLVIGAALERPLNREGEDSSAGVVITGGAVGALAGTITYLCPDWACVVAVDLLHQSTALITLSDPGDGLDGLAYYAVGTVRATAEKAIPGRPPRWQVQCPIKAAL